MTHTYAAVCQTHDRLMTPPSCPEGCGTHWATREPCRAGCPEFVAAPVAETRTT